MQLHPLQCTMKGLGILSCDLTGLTRGQACFDYRIDIRIAACTGKCLMMVPQVAPHLEAICCMEKRAANGAKSGTVALYSTTLAPVCVGAAAYHMLHIGSQLW